MYLANCILNVVSELAILLVPIPALVQAWAGRHVCGRISVSFDLPNM